MEDEGGGRVVVITGGASGIGRATAKRFATAGDLAVIADIDEAMSAEAIEEIEAAGGRSAFHRLDVTDPAAVEAAPGEIEARHGPVAGLVNSAGSLQDPVPLEELSAAEHDRLWDLNYRGTYMCCRQFGLRMAERHRGAIVNIASVSAFRHLPEFAYGPAKAAVVSLTGSLGVELGRRGVRVNAVAPGPTLTPAQVRNFAAGTRDPTLMKATSAMNRMVLPEEIADGIFFLCSDQASAITGVTLPIDCGWLASMAWMLLGGVRHEIGDEAQ